jgi:hypothetical protein
MKYGQTAEQNSATSGSRYLSYLLVPLEAKYGKMGAKVKKYRKLFSRLRIILYLCG